MRTAIVDPKDIKRKETRGRPPCRDYVDSVDAILAWLGSDDYPGGVLEISMEDAAMRSRSLRGSRYFREKLGSYTSRFSIHLSGCGRKLYVSARGVRI